MKRELREAFKRILSIVLMIVMLPLSSLQPAFTAVVHAEGTDEYVAEAPVAENEIVDEGLENTEAPSDETVVEEGEKSTDDEDVATEEDEVVAEDDENSEEDAIAPSEEDSSEDDEEPSSETVKDAITPAAGNENPVEEDASKNRIDETVTVLNGNAEILEETDYPRLASPPVETANLELSVAINESGNAVLNWKKITNEDIEYSIYRNDELIDSFSLDNEEESVSYVDSKTAGGMEYTYKVEGKVADVIYGESNEFIVKTPDILEINSDYTLTSDMTVFEIKNHGGQLNLNGHELTVCKNYLADGYNAGIYLNGGSFICYGDIKLNYYRTYIYMTNAQDYLYVGGNVFFYNNDYSDLRNGTFEIAGNIDANYFRTREFSKIVLCGNERQNINIPNDSYIKLLIDNNISEEGINFVRPAQIYEYEFDEEVNVYICENKVEKGHTLSEDETIEGDFTLGFGVLDLNGHTLTINGDFTQSGGDLIIGDGSLVVSGNYGLETNMIDTNGEIKKTTSGGRLIMKNESGKVKVGGDFTTRSIVNHDGLLTAGTMEFKGDFYQVSGATTNFKATGTHNSVFSGDKKQIIKFSNSWSDQSGFNNLEIKNESEEGVVLDTTSSYPLAKGKVNDNGNKVSGYLAIIESTSFENNHYCSDLIVLQYTTIRNKIETDGNFRISNSEMTLANELIVGGDLNVQVYRVYSYGTIHVNGNFYIGGEYNSTIYFRLNDGSIEVDGDLIVRNSSNYETRIQNYNSSKDIPITVKGNMSLGRNCYYAVDKGILTLSGNLSGDGYIQLGGTHKTILNGTELQKIEINKSSYFAKVEINNSSEEGISCLYFYPISNLVRNGNNLSYEGVNGIFGWTLEEDSTIDGDLILIDDTLDLNGYKLNIAGNLIQYSGVVNINGGELTVDGDYRIQKEEVNDGNKKFVAGSGKLKMVNPDDYVLVNGNFIDQSVASLSGFLTEGTLEVKGDFYQISGSGSNFASTGKHTVILSGDAKQTVKFSNSWSDQSYFNNLEIKNRSTEGVVFDTTSSYPLAKGRVNDYGNKVSGYLAILESTSFENNHYCSDIIVLQYTTIRNKIETDGNFRISNSEMTLANELIVGGDLNVQVYRVYSYSNIYVKGNFYIGGEYNSTIYFRLNDGSIEVDGDFIVRNSSNYETRIQNYNSSKDIPITVKGDMSLGRNCYYAVDKGILTLSGNLSGNGFVQFGGTHKTIFNGTGLQTIDINSSSYFASLEILNTSEEGIVCKYIYPISKLIRNNNKLTYEGVEGVLGWTLYEDTVIDGDLVLIDDTLDLNGHSLEVSGNLIQYSGMVYIHGGELLVDGDYRIQKETSADGNKKFVAGSGMLKMVNPNDYVLIKGSFFDQSVVGFNGLLTEGTLEVKGDFYQISGSNSNFASTGKHTVVLSGDSKQTVKFTNSWSDQSGFNNLEIKNESAEGVVLDTTSSYPLAKGKVNDNGNKVSGYLAIIESTSFENNHYCSDLIVLQYTTIRNKIETDGNFRISNSEMTLANELIVGGDLNVQVYRVYSYGTIHVNGNFYIGGEYNSTIYFRLNDGSIEVDGDLIVRNSSNYETRIQNYNSSKDIPITVKGNMSLGRNCYYAVDKGILTLSGNLSGDGYIQLGGTHKTILNGTELQNIELNSGSYFAYLEISNFSKAGVSFNRMIKYDTFVRNGCRVSFGENSYELGWTLAENEVYDANLYLWDDTLDLNGRTLTVNGDLIAMGGKIDFNGGKLIVNGDFRVQNVESESEGNINYGAASSKIVMDDFEDYLLVNGNFIYYPRTSSNVFSDGTIEIKGDFIQNGGNIFVGKGNNTVKFTGNTKQSITESNTSKFFNFINSNSEELILNSSINVTGSFADETENINGSGTVIVSNPAKVKNGICSGNLQITDGSNLQEDLSVEGTLTINGTMHGNGKIINANNLVLNAALYVDKAKIYVSKNLTVDYYGYLIMVDEDDYVLVNGNLSFNTRYNHSNYLTSGILELRGDFTQDKYQNFIASGSHTTIFSRKKSTTGREYVQTITFNSYAGTTRFNKIVLKKKEKEYHFLQPIANISNEVVYAIEDDEAPSAVAYIVDSEVTEKSVSIGFGGAEDNNGILGYEVYRDGKLLGVTSNTTYVDNSVDSDTQYTYTVFAFDNERNKASSSPALNVRTKKDSEAPSIPQNIGLKTRTGSSITIEWSPSTDNVKVVGYNVYANGEILAENVKETTYKATNLEKTHAYKFNVEAVDKAGNISERSAALEAEVKMPKILSVTPDDNQSIGGENITLNIYFENVGNSTSNKVAVQMKNSNDEWETIVNRLSQKVASYGRLYATYTWDVSELTGEDSYDIRYVLTDADGNEDTKEVTYIIDKEGPEVPDNFKAVANNGNVNISFDASVSADCAGYEIRRATYGEDILLCTLKGRYETIYVDKDVNIGDTYEYAVYAFDNFGNKSVVSERVTVQIEADKVAPEIQDFNPRAGRVNADAKFEISARDNKSVAAIGLQYKAIDATDWIDVEEKNTSNDKATFTFDTTTLADGEYFFNAYAIDASGNKSTELFTRRYEVDNTGIAKIVITDVSSGSSYARIEWEDVTEEDFGYFAVEQLKNGKFEEAGKESGKLGYYVRGLEPNKEYTFRVVGYDDLGNRGIESDEFNILTTEDNTSPTITAVYPESSYYSNVIKLSMDAKDDNELDYAVFSYSLDKENFEEIATIDARVGRKEERFSKDFDISEIREGEIFIKFVVYDIAGNKSPLTSDGTDLIVEYRVDRTAPSKVSNLQCKANEGYVEIAWDAPGEEEKDVKGFKIWRADNANGIYSLIKDNCSTLNFFDNSVKVGSMYLYKVAAVDLAGNVGNLSDEIIVTVIKDNNAPKVYGISPTTNSKICANQIFSVTAIDNSAVASVRLEYTPKGENNYWRSIGKSSENSNYVISKITWDTEKIEEGEYQIRAIATDSFGNESEACLFTYVLDKTPLKVTDISTSTGHFEIEVEATLEDASDYSYMEVLRREVGGEFKLIGKTEELKYVDSDIKANKNYFYKVRVYDEAGNVSLSEEAGGYADDTDVSAPVAALPENYVGIVGMELGLDGLASTDNVRITEYIWNMGNGDVIKGATPRYTYNEPGNYTVTLTVKDAAGNQSSVATTARIYEKTGKGKTKVQIVDEGGMGIPYALVYLKLDEQNGLSLKADQKGYVEIVKDAGVARIAAYKQDYLPSEMEIMISEYEVKEYKLRLVKNELIVGKLTVHRMSLEEMQEAGVIFSDASNNHTYIFTVELVYQQKSYEVNLIYGGGVGGGGGHGASISGPGGSSGNGGSIPYFGKDNKGEHKAQIVDVVDEKPILVTVNKSDSISWLKDMFQVDLTVVNMADYQFAIENSTASIDYPNGLSLAALVGGQSKTEYIGTINGQETKTVSWVLRGDKSGEYEVTADFNGILMPFETPVSAHFVADSSVKVSTGEGIHITIMPESTVDAGGSLYVQYAVENNSDHPIYNFSTSIGPYQAPNQVCSVTDVTTGEFVEVEYDSNGREVRRDTNIDSGNANDSNQDSASGEIYVKNTSKSSQTVLSWGNMPTSFETLYPGQVFYGTYVHPMPNAIKDSEDDKKQYYFELVDAMAECISGEDLGVTLSISPIGGHYHRDFYASPAPTVGDPVDITTGYYQDEVTALSLEGGQTLSYELSYSSGSVENRGEIGYGWNNFYEMRLEQRNGIVWFYSSPNGILSFIKSDALSGKYYGKKIGSKIILDSDNDYSVGEYVGITPNMDGYKLFRNADLTYTMSCPGKTVMNFNPDGSLSQVVSAEKQTISISYTGNNTIIKEDISGKSITAIHDGNGLVTELRDSAGRVAYLSYDGNLNLIAIVCPDGTTLRYSYDENHRIIQASNANGVFVTNEYDVNNRVVNQKDAFGNAMVMSYEDYANYSKKVTVAHANGATQTIFVNSGNAITSEINALNVSATYIYDSKGNLLMEKDPYNNVIEREYDQNNYIIKTTDKGGIVTTLSYDSNGNVTGVFGSDGSTATYSYDSNNHLVSFTDAMGLRTDYTYDSNGLMTSETKGDLGTITYGYTNGLITSITDSLGNISRIEYDACGNAVKTTDAKGNITKYTYNSVGKMLSETDAFGNTSYYTYDCNGNCISVKDSLGNVYKCEYDAMSRLVKETFADGSIVSYKYDNVGNLIKKSFPGGVTETYSYDLCNNLTKVSSSDGSSITYTYDSLGQKTSETDEFGRSVKFEYYPNGSIYKTVFADGSNVIYTYNQRWKCTTKAFSDGSSEYTSYDKNGNVTSITDAMGNIVKFEYDKYNRLIKETDAKGYETKYTYDAKGNCVSKTDAAGRTAHMVYDAVGQLIEAYVLDSKGEKYSVKYEYDALGRVIATTDEEGYTTKVKYDALGNVKSTIDANGNETDITTYDSVGRVTSVKGTDGSVTNYSYDARGNILTAITNLSGINKSSKYTYDAKGRVVSVKENDALTTKVSYDSYGNVASVTDANGGTTKYQYDNLSRLTAVISSLGNKETYTYNAQGLMAELTNARGQKTSYTYDLLGRVTSMTDELGKVNYTYDANGNLTKVEDSKGIIKRTYDSLDRVTSYTDYNGNTIKYSYDELGNLLSITYPGGEVVRYEYYKNGWLKRVVDNNGKVTSYTYNALGQVATCTRPNNTKEIRSYDPKTSRLLVQREVKTDSNGAFVEEISNYVYTYNASGNIESVEGFDNESDGLKTASFKYDAENRLIEYNGKEVKYDADGNMVYGPVNGVMTDLSYDCRNRLIYAGGVRYEYDAENTRIAEETSDYRAVFVTDVVSSDLSKVLVKKTYKKTNGVVSTNSVDRLYVYGNGLISETEGVSTLYHHYNNIGSTMKLSDGLGNIVAEYTYGPYGELLSGNKLTDYLYNGQYGVSTDDNGLYYMRQRYYNSEIKRFINQDILTGDVGNSQSMNRYAYVEGNPINLMDPFGLSPEEANGKSIWSMLIHAGLGVVGCIPGVFGVVANLLDAALYFYEKDYFMATISLLSAASLGTATVAMKAFGATCKGIKVAKGAMLAYRAIDLVGNGVNFVRNAYAFGGQANNIATKAYKGEKITGKDVGGLFLTGLGTFLSGVGTFASVKGLGKAADEFADSLNYVCFVAGTEIDTIEGQKNIEDIEEGDYVLAEDPETGEKEYKPVVRTFINEKDVLMHIFVEDEEIVCTPEHPFYVEGIGFVLAKDLQEGNILRTSDKQNSQVTKVEKEYLDEPIKVYNFEVEDFHTYYVSEKSILVHNECRPTWKQSELDAKKNYPDYESQKSFMWSSEKNKVIDVDYGTKGSVRPDYYKNGYSVDVKNYNIETSRGRNSLTYNIQKQYFQRLKNLPLGTKQSVLIDIRGQKYTNEMLFSLSDRIMEKTNDGIEIIFKTN